jgi:aspartate aminotransferase-like enzyme
VSRPQQLLTPGPTAVPPEVLSALAQPVLHHRSPDFAEVFALAQERLRAVFRTEGEVLVFTSSGTGAFESAIVNVLSPG